MKSDTNCAANQQITELDDGNENSRPYNEQEYNHSLQMEFTTPALEPVADFVPSVRFPLPHDTTTVDKGNVAFHSGDSVFHPDRPVKVLDETALALIAIEAKAKLLGWVGKPTSEIAHAGQGYIVRYEGADIYYSPETGAHEVHGDIRAKYNAFGAANGFLGLPMTDETRTPDTIGRFNHFQGGSIYWTPHTGPMGIRGAMRSMWAAEGWERSKFGYPIADFVTKSGNPPEFWAGFQDGAIYSKNNIAAEALAVDIEPPVLANLVRNFFDRELKAADSDLGIEGGVNILRVTDWGFGFWESTPRTITYEIYGFYSHGFPIAPDPVFRLELEFQFELLWRKTPFTEPKVSDCGLLHSTLRDLKSQIAKIDKFLNEPIPGEKNPPKPVLNPEWIKLDKRVRNAQIAATACENSNTTNILTLSEIEKTLVIYLRSWRISTAGPFNKDLFDELVKKVPEKFPFAVRTIQADALLVDVLVTAQGGLRFLLVPDVDFPPAGLFRRDLFQTELNRFIES